MTRHAAAQRAFFALPLEQKMTIVANENNRGYTPFAEETLDPANSSVGDRKEGLYFGREVGANSSEAQLPLHGPNQWPSDNLVPGYRAVVEEYMEFMRHLGFRLLRILAISLNLPQPEYFHKFFERPMVALRPLHYVAEVSDEVAGRFAAGAHTDYGFCTLLHAPTPGLQIFWKSTWIDVPPKPNAFVVNLGDMLERWTSKHYASTIHRVVNPRGLDRYSCAYFFEPSFDTVVEALTVGRAAGSPVTFPPITSGEYLLSRYAETHAGYKEKMDAGVAKT